MSAAATAALAATSSTRRLFFQTCSSFPPTRHLLARLLVPSTAAKPRRMLATAAAPATAAENVDPAKMAADNTATAPPAKKQALLTPAAAAADEPLRVRRLVEAATLPVRGSALAAGYDVASAEDTEVPARGKALVSTGLVVAVPEGTYGRVAPRSGLAWKSFIDVGAGVIDADYRGELKVLLFNHSDVAFKGERERETSGAVLKNTDLKRRARAHARATRSHPRRPFPSSSNPPPPPHPPNNKQQQQCPRATASRSWCSSASPRPRSSRTPTSATRRAAREGLARRAWPASPRSEKKKGSATSAHPTLCMCARARACNKQRKSFCVCACVCVRQRLYVSCRLSEQKIRRPPSMRLFIPLPPSLHSSDLHPQRLAAQVEQPLCRARGPAQARQARRVLARVLDRPALGLGRPHG